MDFEIAGGSVADIDELRTLVVHDQARARGIGTALLDAVRARLVDRSVFHWSIGLLARNAEGRQAL